MLPRALLDQHGLTDEHNKQAAERRFTFKLCLELGWRSVDEMLSTMSDMEYREWLAYFTVMADEQD